MGDLGRRETCHYRLAILANLIGHVNQNLAFSIDSEIFESRVDLAMRR